MKQKFRKVVKYLLLLLSAVFIGINFRACISSVLNHGEIPMPFGFGSSVVMSGSMEPTLKAGDLIIIKKYSNIGSGPQMGDVIVYQTGTMSVVHRIVDIDGDTIITKGDANNTADEPINKSAVKGKVILGAAFLGYLVLYLKTPLGIVLMIGLVVFFLEVPFKKEKKQQEEDINNLKNEIQQLKQEAKANLENITKDQEKNE